MSHLTASEMSELLSYDPATGVLTWRVSVGGRGRRGTTGKFPAGAIAGNYMPGGYNRVRIDGRIYYGHRIAWALTHGVWPDRNIDHIDGDPSNNKIDNLRDISQKHNIQNQRHALPSNTSGLLGVGWHRQSGKWRARITADGKEHALGLFDSAEIAHGAYLKAKRELHGGCAI